MNFRDVSLFKISVGLIWGAVHQFWAAFGRVLAGIGWMKDLRRLFSDFTGYLIDDMKSFLTLVSTYRLATDTLWNNYSVECRSVAIQVATIMKLAVYEHWTGAVLKVYE